MKQTSIKFLSVFLSITLVLTLFTSPAFANMYSEAESSASADELYETLSASSDSMDLNELLEAGNIALEGEDESLREESSKQFRLSTGHMLAAAYPYEVHYAEDGELKDIDNSLYEDKETGVFRNSASSLHAALPAVLSEEAPVTLESGGYSLSFSFDGVIPTQISIEDEEDEVKDIPAYRAEIEAPLKTGRAEYPEVLPGTDARYELFGLTLEEELVIGSFEAALDSYSFDINTEGLEAELLEDGSIVLKGRERRGCIQDPCSTPFRRGQRDPRFCQRGS
jgi:hypothetical protein